MQIPEKIYLGILRIRPRILDGEILHFMPKILFWTKRSCGMRLLLTVI